jgi:hypothetical protein
MGSLMVISRVIGVLLLVQGAGGYLVNFVLLKPVFAVPPGYLVSAAANPLQVGLAAILGIATGVISLAIAITLWPLFSRRSERMALWFFAFAVAAFALNAVENTRLLSLLSLSQAYAESAAADAALYEVLRLVVAAARNWAHFINLIVGGATIFVFYAVLYRFALVPRVLGALGMLAALLQMTAVAMPLFGQPVMFLLITPLGLCHLALAGWLLVKGLAENQA